MKVTGVPATMIWLCGCELIKGTASSSRIVSVKTDGVPSATPATEGWPRVRVTVRSPVIMLSLIKVSVTLATVLPMGKLSGETLCV